MQELPQMHHQHPASIGVHEIWIKKNEDRVGTKTMGGRWDKNERKVGEVEKRMEKFVCSRADNCPSIEVSIEIQLHLKQWGQISKLCRTLGL